MRLPRTLTCDDLAMRRRSGSVDRQCVSRLNSVCLSDLVGTTVREAGATGAVHCKVSLPYSASKNS